MKINNKLFTFSFILYRKNLNLFNKSFSKNFSNFCRNCENINMNSYHNPNQLYGTTVLAVKRNNKLIMIADGQMTLGDTRFKSNTKKIKKINENIICGFAGALADCTSLIENLESEIDAYPNDLLRACVNLAKTWRLNKQYRNLQASLVVADSKNLLNLDGSGNIIEINEGIIGIGSGGIYAQSAAKALYPIENLSTEEIGFRSMKIAADLCIYTNENFTFEIIDTVN